MLRQGGKTTAINSGGRRKLHTTFEDGSEMVEEYDLQTNELIVRKRRSKTVVGKQESWEYLVGEPEPMSISSLGGPGLVESSQNPAFSRKDIPHAFQWRVRNLPYPKDVYSVTIEQSERKIVLRTSNKKYFKRINIPEMDALGLPLDEGSLAWTYANNTLIVTYTKPRQVLEAEAQEAQANRKIRPQEDGDVDCKQQ
mmetsp:Transcript_3983/g.11251  ORF Transcript_3983/g.11251 Transcript_3983/m.11251 type:complete len:197 (-) Transcript_3983:228-818(-)